jgi:ribulose-5-phosphate 4-epimerase/fuculose-1-phosphate aldolase
MTQQRNSLQKSSTVKSGDLTEQELRIQLAAAYRLIDRFGMSDLIYTHLSARLPGPEKHFLLNPYGLMFSEITASSLIKVDFEGNIIDNSNFTINRTGFVLHSAILSARQDVNCVVHTHSSFGTAVSMLECGLLPVSQFALQFYQKIAYHGYEGLSLHLSQREHMTKDLGDKRVMIMRNHGLLTAGRTIPEAFILMFYLNRTCEAQILAQSSGSKLIIPPESVCKKSAQQQDAEDLGQRQWPALLRLLDKEDPSYRD